MAKEYDELAIVNTTCTEPVNVIVRGYAPPAGRWARLRMAWAVWRGRALAKPVYIAGNYFQQPTVITRAGIEELK